MESIRACAADYASGLDHIRQGLGDPIRAHPLKPVATSKRNLVLCAGSGTTATNSVSDALSMLGLQSAHYGSKSTWNFVQRLMSILKLDSHECYPSLHSFNFTDIAESVDAVVDTPMSEVFLNMYLSFPQAKVILTTRPENEWVHARMRTPLSCDLSNAFLPVQEPCGMILSEIKDRYDDAEHAQIFHLNNEFVRCIVPAEQLFEIDVFTMDRERQNGLMGELATFLGLPPPNGLIFPQDK